MTTPTTASARSDGRTRGRRRRPIDVHLLTAGALQALDTVCRPGIARVTFPFEDVPDVPGVAAQIGAAGGIPWLAIAPGTTLDACSDALPHVDGLLVMLLEPGTSGRSDPMLLAKASHANTTKPVGVDGGVGEGHLAAVLAAGATYVVIGRRLFALTTPPTKTTPTKTTPTKTTPTKTPSILTPPIKTPPIKEEPT